jgi:hypothetical protein
MQDLIKAGTVKIDVDQDGRLWLYIDGKCALHIGECKRVIFRGKELANHVDDDSNQADLSW